MNSYYDEEEDDYIPGYAPAQAPVTAFPSREGVKLDFPTLTLRNVSAVLPHETMGVIKEALRDRGLVPNSTESSFQSASETSTTVFSTTTILDYSTTSTTPSPFEITPSPSSTSESEAVTSIHGFDAEVTTPPTIPPKTVSEWISEAVSGWTSVSTATPEASGVPTSSQEAPPVIKESQILQEWVGGGTISRPPDPLPSGPSGPIMSSVPHFLSLEGGITSAQVVAGTGLFLILGFLLHRVVIRVYRRAYQRRLFVRVTGNVFLFLLPFSFSPFSFCSLFRISNSLFSFLKVTRRQCCSVGLRLKRLWPRHTSLSGSR